MSDRYGYDPYGRQPEILGYDEYGRPVYRQDPPEGYPYGGQVPDGGQTPYEGHAGYGGPEGYEGHGGHGEYGGYGGSGYGEQRPADRPPYEPNAAPQQYEPYQGYEPYEPYDPHGRYPGEQPPAGVPGPQQSHAPEPIGPGQGVHAPYGEAHAGGQATVTETGQQRSEQRPGPESAPDAGEGPRQPGEPRVPQQGGAAEYSTEQFAFVEERTDDSEDVIDWLKFTESRTERREEARRRGRNRIVALGVVLALVLAGGVGYLWQAGKLPGVGGDEGSPEVTQSQQRDVIVVHLRETGGGGSSTALLVDNAEAGRATTLLLPNSMAVGAADESTTTLGKSVEDEGASATRDGLNTLLGAHIKGTWRLDTPFLETLVELLGGITVNTDTSVPGEKKGSEPVVERGKGKVLNGAAAVAYATHRASGEPQSTQLKRFGKVMRATLKEMATDPSAATRTVRDLGQIPDPSLNEKELGASLAKLAERTDSGSGEVELLPVRQNGTLSRAASQSVVRDVLGSKVENSDPAAVLRVSVVNASGDRGAENAASVELVNSGYTVVEGGNGTARARSQVTYAKAGQQAKAEEVAKTLGLPESAVRKGDGAANAEVSVVLGRDYRN